MSHTKKDRNIRSESGNSFNGNGGNGRLGSAGFAAAIARALKSEFGGNGSAIKAVVALTAANERAVKNWFQGRNGPSGEFLILLCRHSEQVLETVLLLAGRADLMAAKKLLDAKEKLREMLAIIDDIEETQEDGR